MGKKVKIQKIVALKTKGRISVFAIFQERQKTKSHLWILLTVRVI